MREQALLQELREFVDEEKAELKVRTVYYNLQLYNVINNLII